MIERLVDAGAKYRRHSRRTLLGMCLLIPGLLLLGAVGAREGQATVERPLAKRSPASVRALGPVRDLRIVSEIDGAPTLAWLPASSGARSWRYYLYRDHGYVAGTFGRSFKFAVVPCGAEQSLGVRAVDWRGTLSAESSILFRRICGGPAPRPVLPAAPPPTPPAPAPVPAPPTTPAVAASPLPKVVTPAAPPPVPASAPAPTSGSAPASAVSSSDSGHPASYFAGPLGKLNFVPSKPGAFLIENYAGPGTTWSSIRAKIVQREQDIGRKFDGIHIQYWGGGSFQGQTNCIDSETVSDRREQWIHDHGSMPIVTWSPNKSIAEVNAGSVDACYVVAARHFKQYGFPIMLRMWWEFDNEDATSGFPWAVGKSGDIGANFVRAWKRVVDIFKREGATNVGFWWTPLEGSPDRPGINASYPGDAYVDWVGSDVYSGCLVAETSCWSTPLHAGWATFSDAAAYSGTGVTNQHDLWARRKPFVYGEAGVAYDPAGISTLKGDWFRGVPSTLRSKLPYVSGISFFDQDVSALEGPRNNWLVDYPASNPDVYAGFKQMAADPWLNTRG